MLSDNEITTRLQVVRERIDAAARRSRHDPSTIRLVLASKQQPPAAIRAVWRAGARDFGENYVQEALSKRAELLDLADIRWHLIGHLQRNKARLAAPAFALIHTIDSARLADALAYARPSDSARPAIRGLVEVNLAAEPSKSGVASDAV